MIKPNWDVFSSKFSTNKEVEFERFAYLLFCREFNLPKGWFGYKNQSAIEKNPIEHNEEVIGFQAKFYSSSLSEHKQDFLDMLAKARRDYPEITKILIYTNQLWTQGFNKDEGKKIEPKALTAIKDRAQELGIKIEWFDFYSEFTCIENSDLSRYYFTNEPFQGWQRFDDWSNTKTDIEEVYFVDNDIKVITPKIGIIVHLML